MQLARIALKSAPAQTVVVTQAIQVGAAEIFIAFNYKGQITGDVFSCAGADIDTLTGEDSMTTGQYRNAVLGAVTDQNAQPSITSVSLGTGS